MDIVCSVGKDGVKRYFKGGRRVKAPLEEISCGKKSKSANKTKKPVEKKVVKKTDSKKTKKARIPDFHIWEVQTGYTTLGQQGNIDGYWSQLPDGKRIGKTFLLPIKHVMHITKYLLETKIPEFLEKNPEKYAVYNSKDNQKLVNYPHSLLSMNLPEFGKILPLKDNMKHVWVFQNMKRPGGQSFTFIKPVLSFFKMRKLVREKLQNQFPGRELFYTDSETSEAMQEIVDMRQNWNAEQWEIFESNIFIKISILSKLTKI